MVCEMHLVLLLSLIMWSLSMMNQFKGKIVADFDYIQINISLMSF
jgi:hypothetical protein